MRETAQLTVALQNGASGWKVNSWAWGGQPPRAVKAKPKP